MTWCQCRKQRLIFFWGPVLITSWVPNRSCYNVRLTSNASLLNQNMLKRIWQLIKMTFSIWGESNASRMAAALSYYTMLSLAPCLMMAIAIAGYIYEDSVVENEIIRQVKLISTPEIAETVKGLIQRASQPRSGIVAGTISVCVLVFAASGVFTQLYDTFNRIWGVSYQGLEGLLFYHSKTIDWGWHGPRRWDHAHRSINYRLDYGLYKYDGRRLPATGHMAEPIRPEPFLPTHASRIYAYVLVFPCHKNPLERRLAGWYFDGSLDRGQSLPNWLLS